MITARIAIKSDIPNIYLMFKDYHNDKMAEYGTEVNKEKILSSVESLIDKNLVFVAECNDIIIGGMAGVMSASLFSDEIYYNSMLFYVQPKYRRHTSDFLDMVELLIGELTVDGQHIDKIIIGNPEFNHGGLIDRFYYMSGYKLLETHFYKPILHKVAV